MLENNQTQQQKMSKLSSQKSNLENRASSSLYTFQGSGAKKVKKVKRKTAHGPASSSSSTPDDSTYIHPDSGLGYTPFLKTSTSSFEHQATSPSIPRKYKSDIIKDRHDAASSAENENNYERSYGNSKDDVEIRKTIVTTIHKNSPETPHHYVVFNN